MSSSTQRIDALEQQLQYQAATIHRLEMNLQRGRSALAFFEMKLHALENEFKQKARSLTSILNFQGLRSKVLSKGAKESDDRQEICRQARKSFRAEFHMVHARIKRLQKKMRSIKSGGSAAVEDDSGVAAADKSKGKGKQMRRIIKEQSKHYRLISQLQKDLEIVKSSRSSRGGLGIVDEKKKGVPGKEC